MVTKERRAGNRSSRRDEPSRPILSEEFEIYEQVKLLDLDEDEMPSRLEGLTESGLHEIMSGVRNLVYGAQWSYSNPLIESLPAHLQSTYILATEVALVLERSNPDTSTGDAVTAVIRNARRGVTPGLLFDYLGLEESDGVLDSGFVLEDLTREEIINHLYMQDEMEEHEEYGDEESVSPEILAAEPFLSGNPSSLAEIRPNRLEHGTKFSSANANAKYGSGGRLVAEGHGIHLPSLTHPDFRPTGDDSLGDKTWENNYARTAEDQGHKTF